MQPRDDIAQNEYQLFLQQTKGICTLCDGAVEHQNEITKVYDHFKIIKNKFPYQRWDSHHVAEHLMIIPHRHIKFLDEMTAPENSEYLSILAEMDARGYSYYLRALDNANRTVEHIHTHLFLLAP